MTAHQDLLSNEADHLSSDSGTLTVDIKKARRDLIVARAKTGLLAGQVTAHKQFEFCIRSFAIFDDWAS